MEPWGILIAGAVLSAFSGPGCALIDREEIPHLWWLCCFLTMAGVYVMFAGGIMVIEVAIRSGLAP